MAKVHPKRIDPKMVCIFRIEYRNVSCYPFIENAKYHKSKKIQPSTYEVLTHYEWPGNIRELENLIERLILTIEETNLSPEHLPQSITGQIQQPEDSSLLEMEQKWEEKFDLKRTLEKVEIQLLTKASKQCKTTYELADHLGISQPTVIYKLKKYKKYF
ncbi:hypothetical protein [Peribacillus muralis]|uniref:hypothetical protein n=1 Tax=Peribacillus muralis TaxID=264697 RepID=UPI003D02F4DE